MGSTSTWVYQNGVKLDFIKIGKPVENAFIENFNGRLRDEFLNTEVFSILQMQVKSLRSGEMTITI